MGHGGARIGAGRKPGTRNKATVERIEKAAASGLMPHEFLLSVSRGEPIGDYAPSFAERLDAAKAAAPYFAPRLANVDVSSTNEHTVFTISDRPLTPEEWLEQHGMPIKH